MATDRDDPQFRALATDVSQFVNWVHQNAGEQDARNEIMKLLGDQLGSNAAQSVVTKDIQQVEQVNLQVALDAWMAEPGRSVDVRGIFVPRHHMQPDLTSLITGNGTPVQLVAPAVVDLPDGPHSTRACYIRALLLVEDHTGRYALLLSTAEHEPVVQLEIAGLSIEQAQAVFAELDALRDRLDVYRGQIVQVHSTPMGGLRLDFLDPTPMPRERLILPEAELTRIESQTLDIAHYRQALQDAGQHLKRGVLLHGPPGTGKTHTVRYVLGQMTGYTRLLLQGAALHAIGPAADLARRLAPSVVVLEDVDLVAQSRSFGHGDNPVLFELLDAMDGAANDADLLFLLTTNRVEVLEAALAARPGRVDVAVHIDRPDEEARTRLFRLYAAAAPLELTDELVELVVQATPGVTASFLKELVRRSVLNAARDGTTPLVVSPDNVQRALAELWDGTQSVTRALLGSHAGDDDPQDDTIEVVTAGGMPIEGKPGFGWFAYSPTSGETFGPG